MSSNTARRNLLRIASVVIGIIPLAMVVWGGVLAAKTMRPPSDLDLSLSKPTSGGQYIASVAPQKTPVPLGSMHSWTVTVADTAGQPAGDLKITIGGGMPSHGHGLPTSPRVTADLGGGKHLIEGVKFNMPGWWVLIVSIDGPDGSENATFNLML